MKKNSTKSSASDRSESKVQPIALRPREAAEALGIGERLLWQMTNRGEIPHTRLGRAVLYPVAELERWLADRSAQPQRH